MYKYVNTLDSFYGTVGEDKRRAFKASAKWREQQMMEKAIDGRF